MSSVKGCLIPRNLRFIKGSQGVKPWVWHSSVTIPGEMLTFRAENYSKLNDIRAASDPVWWENSFFIGSLLVNQMGHGAAWKISKSDGWRKDTIRTISTKAHSFPSAQFLSSLFPTLKYEVKEPSQDEIWTPKTRFLLNSSILNLLHYFMTLSFQISCCFLANSPLATQQESIKHFLQVRTWQCFSKLSDHPKCGQLWTAACLYK